MKRILFVNLRSHKVERIEPIIEAKQLGYQVVLLADKNPELPCNGIDEIIYADTYNAEETIERVVAYHQEHQISGVCTWSDKDVELVAHLNSALNLPGIDPEVVKLARNKYDMRTAWRQVEGISPPFVKIEGAESLSEAVEKVGMPGILKPVGASGSKGIFKIDNRENLDEVYQTLLTSTSPENDKVYSYYPNQYIYEAYLDGDEVSVEGIVQDHKVKIVGITDKAVTSDFSLEYIAIFPSNKNEEIKKEIKNKAERAIKCLGINNCAFHLEGRVTKNGFRIIETAARPGGIFIASHLVKIATGQSFIKRVLGVTMGEDVVDTWSDFKAENKVACFYSIIAKKPGIFKGLKNLDHVFEIPGVKYVIPLKEYGEAVVMPPEHFSSCFLANIVIEAKSHQEVEEKVAKINELVEIVVE